MMRANRIEYLIKFVENPSNESQQILYQDLCSRRKKPEWVFTLKVKKNDSEFKERDCKKISPFQQNDMACVLHM